MCPWWLPVPGLLVLAMISATPWDAFDVNPDDVVECELLAHLQRYATRNTNVGSSYGYA